MKIKYVCLVFIVSRITFVGEAAKEGFKLVSPFLDKVWQTTRDRASEGYSGRLFYLEVNNKTLTLDATLRSYPDTVMVARDSGGNLVGCEGIEYLDRIAKFVTSSIKLWPGFPRVFWIGLGSNQESSEQYVVSVVRDGNFVLYKKPSDTLNARVTVDW
ncbi:unnamed protein product [Orchesella dallaii]|uniref:Uncharacterized protein n=1 Tax=Orchesella dallaii TaxID=48710 RepID=A0ABP1QDQ4_9HEXA